MIPLSLQAVLYTGAVGLLVIGAAGMVLSNHLFRMLLALVIMEAGANLLLVLSGFRVGAVAPILGVAEPSAVMVDPVPQVLVLTAIVIGVGVQALAVGVLVRVYRVYGTLDVRELHRRMELDISEAAGIEDPCSQQAPDAGPAPAPAGTAAREAES